jgi:hypothetical protein
MTNLPSHKLLYLATPYTKYPGGIEAAFIAACKLAAKLLQAGAKVYSPIAHTHPIALHGGINPLDHDIWLPFDSAMMTLADGLLVGQLPGWSESKGVLHEIDVFRKAGKPMHFVFTDNITLEPLTPEHAKRLTEPRDSKQFTKAESWPLY